MDGLNFADVDCFLGCGNGLLKAISFSNKQFVNLNQQQISIFPVGNLIDICSGNEPNSLLVAHETGIVNAYGIANETGLSECHNADFRICLQPEGASSERTALDLVSSSATDNLLRNIAVYEGRLLACWKNGELLSVPLGKAARKKLKKQAQANSDSESLQKVADVRLVANVGGNVERMRQNSQAQRFVAVGGRENDLKIYDLAAQHADVPVFAARNVAHDWLNVRVPVFIKDLAFLDARNRVATASTHHCVRLYDPSSSQRRPVSELKFGDDGLTTIVSRPDRMQVIVGNGKGRLGLIDFRQPARLVRCYKGFTGSVRAVQVDEANSRVMAGGLDRFVFTHNIDTGIVEQRMFVKSQVNCLLLNPNERHKTHIDDVSLSEQVDTTAETDTDRLQKLLDDSGSEDDIAEGEKEEDYEEHNASDESEDEFEEGMRLAPLKRTAKRSREEFIKPSRRKGAHNSQARTITHQPARSSKKRCK